jgi:threonine synthase
MVFETLVNAYLGELLKSLGNFTSPKKNSTSNEKANLSVIIATASPHKFPEVIARAGIKPNAWDADKLKKKLEAGSSSTPDKSMVEGADWFQILQDKIASLKQSQLSQ